MYNVYTPPRYLNITDIIVRTFAKQGYSRLDDYVDGRGKDLKEVFYFFGFFIGHYHFQEITYPYESGMKLLDSYLSCSQEKQEVSNLLKKKEEKRVYSDPRSLSSNVHETFSQDKISFIVIRKITRDEKDDESSIEEFGKVFLSLPEFYRSSFPFKGDSKKASLMDDPFIHARKKVRDALLEGTLQAFALQELDNYSLVGIPQLYWSKDEHWNRLIRKGTIQKTLWSYGPSIQVEQPVFLGEQAVNGFLEKLSPSYNFTNVEKDNEWERFCDDGTRPMLKAMKHVFTRDSLGLIENRKEIYRTLENLFNSKDNIINYSPTVRDYEGASSILVTPVEMGSTHRDKTVTWNTLCQMNTNLRIMKRIFLSIGKEKLDSISANELKDIISASYKPESKRVLNAMTTFLRNINDKKGTARKNKSNK